MKFSMTCGWLAAAILLVGAGLAAQEPAEDEPAASPVPAKKKSAEPNEPHDIRDLPAPLSGVRTNILDLESSGYFAVEAVDIRSRFTGDEAIVWTVRVKKPVTCRHTEALVREFRDARFYATIEKQTLEVIATLVYYPDRITVGSANNQLLRQDDVFELWINLPTTYLQKLLSMHADKLVLRRWRY